MICRVGAVVRVGSTLTVEQHVEAERLHDAIRERPQADGGSDTQSIVVDCEAPTAVHDYVGYIHPEMGLRTRTALAAAGRTRSLETPHDEEIRRIENELAVMSVEEANLEQRRREQTDEREQRERLQEAVATTRGRLAACRERGLETAELERRLEAQIRELAEAETAATATTQCHEQARERARQGRNQRERRFRLEDRLANRRRDARRWLVEELESEFRAAVREFADGQPERPLDCRPVLAGLAVARVAEYSAPLVLEADLFESAAVAHEYLGGPVICV
ncbi:DUF7856 family protein [Halovenus sp. HT40]|uniref:DUF7856 family protein n=1 Tax=Halovenus sp. HT40 TaxID=3126691 RepID=UPI00300E8019